MRIARSLLRSLLRRLLQLLGVVFATAVLDFALLKALPGDLVDVIASESGSVPPQYVAQLRQLYGLDRSLPEQLLGYLGRIAQGDLGYSFRFGEPVLNLLLDRLGPTLALVGAALLLSTVAGVLLGVAAARRPHGLTDTVLSALATVGYSAPMFWTSLMLIVLFGVQLEWLPVGGLREVNAGYHGARLWLDYLRHLALPVLTLAIYYVAVYARLARAAMIETLAEDYIRTARAKGAGQVSILFMHALKNAAVPIVTVVGIGFAGLIGGAVVTESVFAIPGLGRLTVDAILRRDYPVIQGVVLLFSFMYVIVNLAIDILYTVFDPRIRY